MMSGSDEGPKDKVLSTFVAHIPLEARFIFWHYLCSGSLTVRHQNIYKLVSNLDTAWIATHQVLMNIWAFNALKCTSSFLLPLQQR